MIVAVIVATTALAWRMYQTYHGDTLPTQVTSFVVVSPSLIDIEFHVRAGSGQKATCLVRARSADGAEAGRATVAIPAEPAEERVIQYRLATSKKAVTGEVLRCVQAV